MPSRQWDGPLGNRPTLPRVVCAGRIFNFFNCEHILLSRLSFNHQKNTHLHRRLAVPSATCRGRHTTTPSWGPPPRTRGPGPVQGDPAQQQRASPLAPPPPPGVARPSTPAVKESTWRATPCWTPRCSHSFPAHPLLSCPP